MRKSIIISVLLILVLSSLTYGLSKISKEDIQVSRLSAVKTISDCEYIDYSDKIETWGNCTGYYPQRQCLGDNSTDSKECSMKNISDVYPCVIDIKESVKTKKVCAKPKVHMINDKIKLLTANYACSENQDGNIITAICDSEFDGNGDGICTSGESCMKIVIQGNDFKIYEKNSRDEFVPKDRSFFLKRMDVEVEK